MSKWIFVTTADIEEFNRRMDEKRWPIYKHTPHKSQLRDGDDVVFYMGGNGGQKFLGKGTISSSLVHDERNYHVPISNVIVWKKPVAIRPMIPELRFIFRKDARWGVHLQGGVIPLYDDDYKLIISKSSK